MFEPHTMRWNQLWFHCKMVSYIHGYRISELTLLRVYTWFSSRFCVDLVSTYITATWYCSWCRRRWILTNIGVLAWFQMTMVSVSDIEECSSNPCMNGAKCTDAVNSYTCGCVAGGYTGTHCETGSSFTMTTNRSLYAAIQYKSTC